MRLALCLVVAWPMLSAAAAVAFNLFDSWLDSKERKRP